MPPHISAHPEVHAVTRTGWLRAAVLGANDGIVSTASLILGVAAGGADRPDVLLAGLAGMVAGALSMAAGEYVSVSAQADAEKADLTRETRELAAHPEREHAELVAIYRGRGLDQPTAEAVVTQLTAYDALAAHARDEMGLTDVAAARPLQAAFASAAAFAIGAGLPLITVVLAPAAGIVPVVAAASLLSLILLGTLGAVAGKAPILKSVARIVICGALAMAFTALIGGIAGTVV